MNKRAKISRAAFARWGTVTTIAALTALSGQSVAGAAEATIIGADTKNAIEGSYIVVLKDGVSAQSEAKSHAGQYGAAVKYIYKSALHGYAARMNEAQALRLAADPAVAYVEQDQKVSISTDQLNPPSWGLDRVDQRDLPLNNKYSYSTTASNVTAYIIDTGINFGHTDFGGRATSGYDAVDGGSADDCQGHGTHVAGTVGGSSYGLAKAVKLKAVRVLDCNGSGSNSGVIAGVDWVTSNAVKPAVANMSLGGGANTALDDAVKRSISSGVTYAIASGNGDFLGRPANACNYSPARTGGANGTAITVNASASDDTKASFSNYGTCTDLYAPGVSIKSAWIGSSTATKTISGTSMATPHVAGAAALYLATNTSASPATVKSAILNNASTSKISSVPSGTPNRLLFTGTGGTTPPPDPGTCGTFSNGTNVNIPDAGSAVTSSVTVSGCNRKAMSTSKVFVDIKHTWRGDLVVDLITPTGAVINLKGSSSGDSADNVNATYTKDLSAYNADGVWKLRVRDVYTWDTGYIDNWSITP